MFDGNQAEAPTLLPTLTKVLQRFPHIRRLIIVADRGWLSLDNIQALQAIELGGGRALEFILAVPARRYGEFVDIRSGFKPRSPTMSKRRSMKPDGSSCAPWLIKTCRWSSTI